jgi:hypothetical protein
MTVLELTRPRPAIAWKATVLIAVLLAAACIGVFGLSLIPQSDRGQFAVVFRPDMTRDQISESVERANGKVVREGSFGTLVVAHFDDPGFESQLKSGGALFVLNPSIIGGR